STIGVVLTAFIGHSSAESSRGRSLGLQESAIACGSLAGPVLGGVMLDHWSLKPLLTGTAAVTGIAGLLLWSRVREPDKAAPAAGADPFV
ncbi:MFS transporter, partial [Acinetobacter baumannii]